jgi:aminoglycoside/choline kinase family phosphotransferase
VGRIADRYRPACDFWIVAGAAGAPWFVESIIHEPHATHCLNTATAPTLIDWADPSRRASFERWLQGIAAGHALKLQTLRPASADASFRRYFRVDGAACTFIVMDAPPPLENVRPFIHVAGMLLAIGLNAPQVLQQDVENGFLLLSDLGTELYLDALNRAVAAGDTARQDSLMRDAVRALVQWQLRADPSSLPAFDESFLRRELALFPEWCVKLECGVSWSTDEQQTWQAACDALVSSALAQTTVAMLRDYMPRNLMVTAENNPGILDFQDAVRGPITYDMASLLRDAFISWDEEFEIDCAVRYWQAARQGGLALPDDFGEFWRQVEWMGLQRHLKVLGLFCRLKHRDGKPAYSTDLPRFFNYAHKVASRYNALRPLSRLLEPLMGAERVEGFY